MLTSPQRSTLISACLHAGAIVVIVSLTRVPDSVAVRRIADRIFMPLIDPAPRPDVPRDRRGGGGGGQRDPTPARFGRLPRFATREFVPPTTHLPTHEAPITIEPAILAPPSFQIEAIDLSKLGSPTGVHYGDSGGMGSGGGIGDHGKGGGVGDHQGPGYGDADGGGFGVGASGIRGALTVPVLLTKTEPEYSEEGRRAKLQGAVILQIEIDAQGRPRNPRILQSLGLGLDERATESVMRWRFRPAMRNGKPVASPAQVYVNFRLL